MSRPGNALPFSTAMRRHRPLILPLLLAALALPACGSSDDSANEAAATPTAATEAPTETPAAESGGSGPAVKVTGKAGEKPEIEVPKGDPPAELVIEDAKKGKGAKATAGQSVSVQYVGVLYKDGEQFDASWDRNAEPFEFSLGKGMVIPGWDQGVEGMQVGGRRVLTIPPDLAYGAGGSGAIGPNETLVFVIDMEKIS
jgi:peptidylprolyl isomerase